MLDFRTNNGHWKVDLFCGSVAGTCLPGTAGKRTGYRGIHEQTGHQHLDRLCDNHDHRSCAHDRDNYVSGPGVVSGTQRFQVLLRS